MPIRTTPDRVREIADEVSEDDGDVEGFIESASILVDVRCAPLGYSDAELENIERWLAAHLYHVDRSKLLDERIGRAGERKMSQVGLGLDLTHHGQQVKLLFDYKNGLRREVKMVWLGRDSDTRRRKMLGNSWYYRGYWGMLP